MSFILTTDSTLDTVTDDERVRQTAEIAVHAFGENAFAYAEIVSANRGNSEFADKVKSRIFSILYGSVQ